MARCRASNLTAFRFAFTLAAAFIGVTCARPAPALADEPVQPLDRGTFVLVYDSALKDAAIEWAAYRAEDGWRVIMQPVETTHIASDSESVSNAKSVREQIRAHWRLAQPDDPSSFMVLILGDPPDLPPVYQSDTVYRAAGVPTWRFLQADTEMRLARDRTYISDHPYQLMDDADDLPDVPLGRVPARTNEEAFAVLVKIRQYESAKDSKPLEGISRVTYVAGEGHYGLMDSVLESLFKTMVDQLVPATFDVSMTYAKATSPYCPPPSQLADTVLARLGEGCVLFNYVGHGFERGFDALMWRGSLTPILTVADLARLSQHSTSDAQMPIALLTCCSTGWFDLPNGAHSLAEALLLSPHGPVAVIAGSRVTHPYANIIVQKDVTQLMLRDRTSTVGMVDLLAARSMVDLDEEDRQIDAMAAPIAFAGRWQSDLMDLRRMHVRLYSLLGDPATRVSLPAAGIAELELNGTRFTATVSGMKSGTATITVEAARTALVWPYEMQMVIDANDVNLEAKAATNYLIANDRTLFRTTAAVRDGLIDAAIDQAAASVNGAIIRVQAAGLDHDGEPLFASGAIKFTARGTTTAQGGIRRVEDAAEN